MKILEANAGALTNFEVLDFLRSRGAGRDPTRVIVPVAPSEFKIIEEYDTRFGEAAEAMEEFVETVQLLPPPPTQVEPEQGTAEDQKEAPDGEMMEADEKTEQKEAPNGEKV